MLGLRENPEEFNEAYDQLKTLQMIHLILFRSFLMTKSSWLAGDLEELMRRKLNNWMMICEKKDIGKQSKQGGSEELI